MTHDDFYSSDIHQLTSAPARSQQVCAYDMDDIDLAWLNRVNNQRNAIGKYSMLSIGWYHTFSFMKKLWKQNVDWNIKKIIIIIGVLLFLECPRYFKDLRIVLWAGHGRTRAPIVGQHADLTKDRRISWHWIWWKRYLWCLPCGKFEISFRLIFFFLWFYISLNCYP